MKTSCSNQRNHGLTLFEVVVIIFVLGVLMAVLLPTVSEPRKSSKINCMNNLKQNGLAFRIWEGDNNDKYPMAVASTNGGAMEAVAGGNPARVFQVMSNELSTCKILLCPADRDRYAATNFSSLSASNISYFINVDAVEANPQGEPAGDTVNKARGPSRLQLKQGRWYNPHASRRQTTSWPDVSQLSQAARFTTTARAERRALPPPGY